jgi:aldehyde:ferredoxin oxidoreductase
MKTGFDSASVKVPERFKRMVTWKGPLDRNYLDSLQKAYAQRIREMAKSGESSSSGMG